MPPDAMGPKGTYPPPRQGSEACEVMSRESYLNDPRAKRSRQRGVWKAWS
jgi:hypothetical protein